MIPGSRPSHPVNFLAHFLLADRGDPALVGAFLGDFAKGPVTGFASDVATEILVHRRIDSSCDAHPVMRAARECFAPERRRFADIAMDVFHDHVLARDWPHHASEPLPVFTARVYRALHEHADLLPESARRVAARMAQQDWLGAYANFDGARAALAGIGRRLSRGGDRLEACAIDLQRHYARLSEGFAPLFADLRQIAEDTRRQTHARHG
jgi:acyl carrier protein phosphodiesterase